MKIAIGLSGGVDSSVAALLLKEQGYDLVGLFMQNWNDASVTLHGNCTWEDDRDLAQMTAKKLGIPFVFTDLSATYKKRVVDYMFAEYEAGRTPNPDVLCNREIKFDAFLDQALQVGADMVATGHYCRRAVAGGDPPSNDEIIRPDQLLHDTSHQYRLLAGLDDNKDQSYFLCQLNQAQLSRALFPIGGICKPRVRELARLAGLPTADRKDSQGICFVGKVDLPVFLQQQLAAKEGDVVEIPASWEGYSRKSETTDPAMLSKPHTYLPSDGKIVGRHQGAHFYTIGQRKGLHIGGHAQPLFIIATDVQRNVIYVGEGERHPGLYRPALFIPADQVHWVRDAHRLAPGEERPFLIRVRYRQPLQQGVVKVRREGLYVVFDQAQRSVTPGQFAAWYDGEELMGSGPVWE